MRNRRVDHKGSKVGSGRPLLVGLLVFAVGGSCAINPLTGKRELALVSEQQEIQIGQQAAQEVALTIGVYDEKPELSSYVDRIGKAMSSKSERPELPWSFKVVDDPVVNAFALPGGPIHVTRGLLAYMDSEAQLASVVGHEIGHITGRHSVKQMSKATVAQLGLVVGMAVSDTIAGLGELGMGGLSLLFLKYGRDAEREADDVGFRYAMQAGYDVRAMPGVFATLKRVSESSGGDRLPDWLASHPSPDERIERINKMIAEKNPPPGKVERDAYLAITNGIVYGPDPRAGYFEGDTFKHPKMKFQMQMPAGWKRQNLSAAVVAQAPDGKTQFQLTLAKEASPAEALQKFKATEGVTDLVPVDLPLHVPGNAAKFAAKTEEGPVMGLIAFVTHDGKTIQMMGLGLATSFPTAEPAIRATQSSFAPLTDPAALSVEPARLKIVAVPGAMTLAEFASRHPNLSPEKLAVLNQLEPSSRLTAGQKIKVVEGKIRSDGSGT